MGKVFEFLQLHKLNQKLTPFEAIAVGIYAVLFVSIYSALYFYVDLSRFTWDSWIYYKLSAAFTQMESLSFSEYARDKDSIAFPFGYPLLLSLAHSLFGFFPSLAVIINIVCAFISTILLCKLAGRSSGYLAVALAASLCFNPFYLEEVFSGRSIPFAMLLVLAAVLLQRAGTYLALFFAGVIFGASVLVRFDLLVGAFVLQNLMLAFYSIKVRREKSSLLSVLLVNAGFFLGACPWILFSWSYFGTFWVSNNSVVAISSIPVTFTGFNDYSLMAEHTVFNEPVGWLYRVFSNVMPLSKSAVIVALVQPFFLVTIALLLVASARTKSWSRVLPVFLLTAVFAPYLLAGFFDHRYFTLYFLAASLFLIFSIPRSSAFAELVLSLRTLIVVFCPLIMLTVFALYFVFYLLPARQSVESSEQYELIAILDKCHLLEPETTYIFQGSNVVDAFYYGITGNKVVFPVGFQYWDHTQRKTYLDGVAPYRVVSRVTHNFQCSVN